VGIAEAGVDADIGHDADELAKRHELIHAEIVGLHGAPGVVPVGRPLIAIADGVVPDEVRRVIATVTPEAGLDLADERNGVGAEAFDVVRGHERERADVEVACAGSGDFKRGVGRVGSGSEGNRILFVLTGERRDGDGLAVVRSSAPNKCDVDLGARSSTEIDAAGIPFPVNEGEACLPDSMRSRGVERDARTLVADKGIVLVHHHNLVRPDGTPLADLHAHGIALARRLGFGVFGDDGEVELAVVEHLSPEAAVHGAADVLDEHAVLVWRDGHTGLRGVDCRHDLVRRCRRLLS